MSFLDCVKGTEIFQSLLGVQESKNKSEEHCSSQYIPPLRMPRFLAVQTLAPMSLLSLECPFLVCQAWLF